LVKENDMRTLATELIQVARKNWDRRAMVDSTAAKLTFGEMLIGALLFRSQIKEDEQQVGVLLPASVGAALVNYAIALAGKTSVNINFTAGKDHLQFVQESCELKTIFTSRAFLEKVGIEATPQMVFVEEVRKTFSGIDKAVGWLKAKFLPSGILARGEATDVATILYSSGSTGVPKGIMLSHENVLANMDAVAQVYSVNEQDSMLGSLPFFHSFGFVYTLWFPILHGFRVAYHPNPIDAKKIGELADENGVTFLLSTPTFAQGYVKRIEPKQFHALKYVLVGAEKLSPELNEKFKATFGVEMQEGYGCTEMSPVIAVNALDLPGQVRHRDGSVGRPLPGTKIKIVNAETFEEVKPGEPGLLLSGGPSRMLGYWKDPERTKMSLRDGLYVTGDIVRQDEDGFLFITDRLARFSKIGGEMISHGKTEEVARRILPEAQIVVCGVPDSSKGERLVLMYVGEADCSAALWKALQESELPAIAVPKKNEIVRVDLLPTLGTGKLDLQKVKKMAAEVTVGI
jgi:acyl-[acyl-carrier-protein]-phospholipid O-acyltransferase / long-chain-fatty-acid--[acyl-carrier-protein] ligase